MELTLVLNNQQGTNLEIGLQRKEVNHSQSSKWTNGRFRASSGIQRDVVFKRLRSDEKLQEEFCARGNHAQRKGIIRKSKIKPSITQIPKSAA